MFTKTCWDLWKEECKQMSIVTFCRDLDHAIGNGISVGMITELCGPPGSGKTQILEEIANACVRHCQKVVEKHKNELALCLNNFNVGSLMSGVYYKYLHGISEVLDGIDTLEELLKSGDRIRLVVIDSISFLIRNHIENSLERIRVDHIILTRLHVLAQQYKCAIVITNDVTTRLNGQDGSRIVPALGDAHSHKINQRIVIGPADDGHPGLRIASVEKGLFRSRMAVKFQINQDGVRGVKKR